LWRIFENANIVLKSVYNEVLIGAMGFVSIIDVKQLHATGGFGNFIIGETEKLFQQDYFTPKALQKYGY